MKILACALVTSFVLAGSAIARDKHRGSEAPRYQTQQQSSEILGWNDESGNPTKKLYPWPDQRYYGQHGMMLD